MQSCKPCLAFIASFCTILYYISLENARGITEKIEIRATSALRTTGRLTYCPRLYTFRLFLQVWNRKLASAARQRRVQQNRRRFLPLYFVKPAQTISIDKRAKKVYNSVVKQKSDDREQVARISDSKRTAGWCKAAAGILVNTVRELLTEKVRRRQPLFCGPIRGAKSGDFCRNSLSSSVMEREDVSFP